jgi:hypothetical protein
MRAAIGVAGALLLLASSGVASAGPIAEPVQVARVEVTFAENLAKHDLADDIRQAVLDEQSWYRTTGRPVLMTVNVDKLSFRSTGKALAGSIPFVGMFAPPNDNYIRATVRIRDAATGATLAEYRKIGATDQNGLSAVDMGATALSFIPVIGDIAGAASDVAQAGANKRDLAEQKMSRNLAARALSQLYGERPFATALARKKLAAAAAKAAGQPIPLALPTPAVTSETPAPTR